jgi:urea transport system ATP-binding protein
MLRRRKAVEPAVEEALEIIGLEGAADKKAGILAHGQKQWLEIGMLLVQNSDVLLLDEPIAGMSQDERAETGALLRRIAASRITLVIEHDMDFVREFATSVSVLAAGKVLSEGSVAQVQADPKVQEVYLGTWDRKATNAENRGSTDRLRPHPGDLRGERDCPGR